MKEEVKSLHSDEVIGDIIDIELDKRALSIFDVTKIMSSNEMVLRVGIIFLLKQIHLLLQLWMMILL